MFPWLRLGALEGCADGEVEGAVVFVFAGVEGVAVFEADGADGKIEPDACADGVAGVIEAEGGRVRGEAACIEEDDAFDDAGEGADVFGVGDEIGTAAERDASARFYSEIAFGEAPHGV